MFKWIRKKLGITELESTIAELESKLTKANSRITDLRTSLNGTSTKCNALMNLVDVGIDVTVPMSNRKNHSWVVVCLNGKIKRMQFYVLPPNDIKEVRNFLSMFDRSNQTIDAPQFIRSELLNY